MSKNDKKIERGESAPNLYEDDMKALAKVWKKRTYEVERELGLIPADEVEKDEQELSDYRKRHGLSIKPIPDDSEIPEHILKYLDD